MTMEMPVKHNVGFTLIETILYIGLFSMIFTGIFVSIYPLFTGAERLTRNIAGEGETSFLLAKIDHALSTTLIDSNGTIITPALGETAEELVLAYNGEEYFHFAENQDNTFCTAPLLCHTLTQSEHSGDPLPLNTQRVSIEDFSVTHALDGAARYVEITFRVNGADQLSGPYRYYTHF